MPNNRDFSQIVDIKTVELKPEGWVSPLYIEYGIDSYNGIPSYFWRVKGTLHTFIIAVTRLDFLSQGDYNEHFKEFLENFREEYLTWAEKGFNQEWMQQYREQYFAFVSL